MRAEPLPELAAAYLELTQARACLEIGPHVALPTTSAARSLARITVAGRNDGRASNALA